MSIAWADDTAIALISPARCRTRVLAPSGAQQVTVDYLRTAMAGVHDPAAASERKEGLMDARALRNCVERGPP